MDFFQQQDSARRRTKLLVVYFVLAVVLIILAVYFAFVAAFFGMQAQMGPSVALLAAERVGGLWYPQLFLWVTLGTLAVVAAGSLYKTWSLSGGGAAVAILLGGRQLDPGTADLAERKVLNVVEEMAIASGTPVPPVYLLEEAGINAFAAGHSPGDAVIGVTRGCMQLLSRDELQGVVAHEFSHILNGDMRLNLRLMGLLHGILIIGIIGYLVMRIVLQSGRGSRPVVRSSGDKKGGGGGVILALFVLGLLLCIIGYVGTFFGQLIKSAVSRQREFLADASAVQFTRNPAGIAGALIKIGGLSAGSCIEHEHAGEASHMFFEDALRPSFLNLLATHPPLLERIRRLDPSFDGHFPATVVQAVSAVLVPESEAAGGLGFASGVAAAGPRPKLRVRSEEVVQQVGAPQSQHRDYAQAVRDAIPASILAEAREPCGARAVICALLVDADAQIAARQFQRLAATDAALGRETQRLLPTVCDLKAECRLPLIDLAVPALQRLSPAQYASFRQCVQDLIAADAQEDLFEYTLQRVLLQNLEPRFGKPRKLQVAYYALAGVTRECAQLLSALAYAGQREADAAQRAFAQGAAQLGLPAGAVVLLPSAEAGLDALDQALAKLVAIAPPLKRRLLAACADCVVADGEVTIEEAELLRAVSASLDCPMPPLLAAAA